MDANVGRENKRSRPEADETEDSVQKEIAELRQRLEEANKRAEEYVSLVQRVQADFVNYKRRIEQEREERAKYAQSKLMLTLLPVLDDLERAMDSVKADLAGLHWVQGIGHIVRKLQTALESEGLTKIDALGQEFDPRYHEAVLYEDTDPEHGGKVLSVLQSGYKLHDRVIRPAMVKVGKGIPTRQAPDEQQQLGATFKEEDYNA